MRRFLGAPALVICIALLVACGAPDAGHPSAAVSSSGGPAGLAPRVERPLDARGVKACAILGGEELTEVGLAVETAVDDSNTLATSCTWQSRDGREVMRLVLSIDSTLDLLYASRDVVLGFHELEVEGHPAVREGAAETGICTVYVALANTQVFSAEFSSLAAGPSRSCEKAETVATAVVRALDTPG